MNRSAAALVTEAAQQRQVHAAFQYFHLREKTIFDWQLAATLIPSPSFGEHPRAKWLLEQFRSLGLSESRLDDEGNCLALLPGTNPNAPALLISAHIDTVFAAGTPLTPRTEGERIYLPGLADNGVGIAAILALAAAFLHAELKPAVPILFCGNVGEEGLGNLRGMRRIFRDAAEHNIAAAIVLDGTGATPAVGHALGSRRFEVSITGPGGHAWSDAANPNPLVAMGRAIARMTASPLPETPRTSVNFARVTGGDAINAIPEQASASVDIRSEDGAEVVRQEVLLYRAVEDAVTETNGTEAKSAPARKLQFEITPIGERPAGVLPADSFLAQSVAAVDRHMQLRTQWRIASTDANIPLALGVPAVSLGAGGSGGGTHTLNEWFEPAGREVALRRILLLALATSAHIAAQAAGA